MKYLVFVDFDGVLTSGRCHFVQPTESYGFWTRFDPIAMDFFNKIHFTFDDVSFVWTTSWRNNVDQNLLTEHLVYSSWYNAGFRGHLGNPWRVNDENNADLYGHRAVEIQNYLDKSPTTKDFVILDDTDYNFDKVLGKKRFVKTHPQDGLLHKHMLDTWSKMGTWDRK